VGWRNPQGFVSSFAANTLGMTHSTPKVSDDLETCCCGRDVGCRPRQVLEALRSGSSIDGWLILPRLPFPQKEHVRGLRGANRSRSGQSLLAPQADQRNVAFGGR